MENTRAKTREDLRLYRRDLEETRSGLVAGGSLDTVKFVYGRLLDDAIAIFQSEPAVLDIKADKAIIVGDLHGDVQTFGKITNTYRPEDHTFILMGDYVDRGKNAVELLSMLLVNKLLYPNSFMMLRGDHESQEVNPQTFPSELYSTLGYFGGVRDKVYGKLFAAMPVAATLNNKYFVAHGGIPVNAPDLAALRSMQKVPEPENNGMTLQILWNDPISEKGVAASERGDGIYYFGRDIAESFLKKNGLELIIRGHRHRLGGLSRTGNTLTLLSTTAYPGDGQYIARLSDGKLSVLDVSGEKPVAKMEEVKKERV